MSAIFRILLFVYFFSCFWRKNGTVATLKCTGWYLIVTLDGMLFCRHNRVPLFHSPFLVFNAFLFRLQANTCYTWRLIWLWLWENLRLESHWFLSFFVHAYTGIFWCLYYYLVCQIAKQQNQKNWIYAACCVFESDGIWVKHLMQHPRNTADWIHCCDFKFHTFFGLLSSSLARRHLLLFILPHLRNVRHKWI